MDLTALNDAELIRCIQDKRSMPPQALEAIGMLYDRHHAAIFRYLLIRTSCQQQAEDLTGDVFTRMISAISAYREREIPFRAWLYRIAHHLLIDLYRKENNAQWVELNETHTMAMDEQDPITQAETRLAIADVRRALDGIDPQQRDVIVLRFLIGLQIKEVALVLEKTIPTIKALQFRGLHNLRAKLAVV